MNSDKIKKQQLIRQILFEARKLTMAGYGKIAFKCKIVDKQPEGSRDYDE